MNDATAKYTQLSESTMLNALAWAYEKALAPEIPGIFSADDLVRKHKKHSHGAEKGVRSLMRWLSPKAATSVFFCGVSGLMTMPEGVPANISSVLFVQARIIAALAIIGGYDVKNQKVRSLLYAGLCGDLAKEILKSAGVKIHQKISMSVVNHIPDHTFKMLHRKVCFRLITKFSENGVISLCRAAPFVGEIVCETFDAMDSRAVVKAAENIFNDNEGHGWPIRLFSKAS